MPGQYTIRVDSSLPPVQHVQRKVLLDAREEIEKALQKMVDNGFIAPVTEPTEWVSSLTYPRKSDGTIHPCLDPCNLNKAIICEHYKTLTLEEISHKLSSATVFSKFDAKDGFWSIHLDTPSSYLTTVNTHKGCYWYLHMPFGLKMSQDVFQMCINQITHRLPWIIAIHDDICVFGKTREEHDIKPSTAHENSFKDGLVSTVTNAVLDNCELHFMVQFSPLKEWNQTQQKFKLYKTSLPLKIINSCNHF